MLSYNCSPTREFTHIQWNPENNTEYNHGEHDIHHSYYEYVESGDLSIWEYLTKTYDHDCIFEQTSPSATTREPEYMTTNNLQHKVSTSPLPFEYVTPTQNENQVSGVHHEEAADYPKSFHENSHENNWIDPYTSGIQSLPRPIIEPFPMGHNDQKIKAVKTVAKQSPLSNQPILLPNSSSWLSSIDTTPEPPTLSALSNHSYIRPIEPAVRMQTTANSVELTIESIPATKKKSSRITKLLSHLQFPSISHIVPPYHQQRDRKLLLTPLSPYNYYYRDERDNIVNNIQNSDDPLPPPISDHSQEKLEKLLFQRWFEDPIKIKRRHRKSHGRISFEMLARVISERWHEQPDDVHNFYYTVSSMDKLYYREHMKVIHERTR